MSFLAAVTDFFTAVVRALGYPGIFLAMFIEGVITPIPSEMILPFAGFLAREGQMAVAWIVLVASLGAMAGSGGAYWLGLRYGRAFVLRWGRYLFLDGSDLDRAEGWFRRWGTLGVFLANCAPGSRSIAAYPAGAGRMPFVPFLAATFGGAVIWNSVLTLAGWYFGRDWVQFVNTFEVVDLVALVAILVGIGSWIWYNKRRKERLSPSVPRDRRA